MKNKIFLIVLLLVVSVGFYACKKDKKDNKLASDAADFTYVLDDKGGVTITVTNASSGAHIAWGFGNGVGIIDEIETNFMVVGKDKFTRKYYYKNNGTYTLTLTASDVNKGQVSSSQTITISTVPTKAVIKYFKLKDYPILNPANNGN